MKIIICCFFILLAKMHVAQPQFFQYQNLSLVKQLLPTSETPKNVILHADYAITVSEREIQVINCEDINNPIKVNHQIYSSESMGLPELSISKNYLTLLGNKRIKVFNISDLTNIKEEKTLDIIIEENFDYEVKTIINNKAFYSLGDFSKGARLVIYDITNPVQPILKGSYFSSTRINGIMVSDTTLVYLSTMKGIEIIDISNLDEPKYLLSYDGNNIYGKGIFFEHYLVVTEISTANIVLIDVNDLLNPLKINYYFYGGEYPEKLVYHNNFLMASSNFHPSSLSVYNISNLSNHNRVAEFYNGSKGSGYGIAADGNLIYYCGLPNADEPPTNHGLFIFKNNLITSVGEKQLPIKFDLAQNYPNPFNPTTVIKYQISNNVIPSSLPAFGVEVEGVNVQLKVYNVLGKEVTTLVNKEQTAGNYEVEFLANELPSGVYFYRLQAGSFIETKKMVLLR